jgi:hypothetical protein
VFDGGGKAAVWLARMVGADMPRCDTEEVLKGCSKDLLIATARAHGLDDTGTTAALRARMVGKLPDWRPVGFDLAGPEVAPEPEPETEEGEPEAA